MLNNFYLIERNVDVKLYKGLQEIGYFGRSMESDGNNEIYRAGSNNNPDPYESPDMKSGLFDCPWLTSGDYTQPVPFKNNFTLVSEHMHETNILIVMLIQL